FVEPEPRLSFSLPTRPTPVVASDGAASEPTGSPLPQLPHSSFCLGPACGPLTCSNGRPGDALADATVPPAPGEAADCQPLSTPHPPDVGHCSRSTASAHSTATVVCHS